MRTERKTCRRAWPLSKRICASAGFGYHYHSETDPAAQAQIWSLREAALGLSMATKDDAKSISFVEDTAVAPEKLSAFIGRFLEIIHGHGTTAGIYAHASVGCLHVRPVINMKTAEGIENSKPSPTMWPIWCWNSAARFPANMATVWCAAPSWSGCSGRFSTRRSARSSAPSIRKDLSIPARSSMRRR